MINPVIKHLLSRKNKKVPVKDRRKIVLVLFGGGMTGVRGAGAVIALEELGLTDAFDEIYASSAGFCNASYFLAKSTRLGTSIYYEDLPARQYISLLRFWNMADSKRLIDAMRNGKPLNVKRITQSNTKLFSYVKNERNEKGTLLEANRFIGDRYFNVMEASTKMPYLSPGSVKIGKNKYKDTLSDVDWAQLVKKSFDSEATDILVIYNHYDQYSYVHKHVDFLKFRGNICEIHSKPTMKLSRVETTPSNLRKAAVQMGSLVKNAFGSNKKINLKPW